MRSSVTINPADIVYICIFFVPYIALGCLWMFVQRKKYAFRKDAFIFFSRKVDNFHLVLIWWALLIISGVAAILIRKYYPAYFRFTIKIQVLNARQEDRENKAIPVVDTGFENVDPEVGLCGLEHLNFASWENFDWGRMINWGNRVYHKAADRISEQFPGHRATEQEPAQEANQEDGALVPVDVRKVVDNEYDSSLLGGIGPEKAPQGGEQAQPIRAGGADHFDIDDLSQQMKKVNLKDDGFGFDVDNLEGGELEY